MAVNTTVQVTLPAMGESVREGTVLEWHRQEGETIVADETLVEVSTDKVDAEVPAPATGTLVKIHVAEGETIAVGAVLAEIAVDDVLPAAVVDGALDAPADDGVRGVVPTIASPASHAEAAPSVDAAHVSPVARRIAAAEGVDLAALAGSGPAGRITKADVLAARAAPEMVAGALTRAAPTVTVSSELRGGAAMLARHMEASREIPTATSLRTITVTTMDVRRAELKAAGHKISFTHLIAYAIARAATEQMPVMAHHYAEVDGKPHRIDDGAVNLGIAVDVEKKDGSRTLMVPVIRDAGRLSFPEFLDAFGRLIGLARDNRLTADDLTGGNLTLTNPGGIGTHASVPRLMSGQGTIVATGAIGYRPGSPRLGR